MSSSLAMAQRILVAVRGLTPAVALRQRPRLVRNHAARWVNDQALSCLDAKPAWMLFQDKGVCSRVSPPSKEYASQVRLAVCRARNRPGCGLTRCRHRRQRLHTGHCRHRRNDVQNASFHSGWFAAGSAARPCRARIDGERDVFAKRRFQALDRAGLVAASVLAHRHADRAGHLPVDDDRNPAGHGVGLSRTRTSAECRPGCWLSARRQSTWAGAGATPSVP